MLAARQKYLHLHPEKTKLAKSKAEATRMAGEAEAAAIDAKGRALKDNPQLVDLVQAERWDGVLPTTMVPGGSVPMVTLK